MKPLSFQQYGRWRLVINRHCLQLHKAPPGGRPLEVDLSVPEGQDDDGGIHKGCERRTCCKICQCHPTECLILAKNVHVSLQDIDIFVIYVRHIAFASHKVAGPLPFPSPNHCRFGSTDENKALAESLIFHIHLITTFLQIPSIFASFRNFSA